MRNPKIPTLSCLLIISSLGVSGANAICWQIHNPTENRITVYIQRAVPPGKVRSYSIGPGNSSTIHGVDDCIYNFFIRHHIGNELIIDYGVDNVELNSLLLTLSRGGVDEVSFPEKQRFKKTWQTSVKNGSSHRHYVWSRIGPVCMSDGYVLTPTANTRACLGVAVGPPHIKCPDVVYPDPVPIPDLPNDDNGDEGDGDAEGDESKLHVSYQE